MELIGEKSCPNGNDQIQKVEPGNLLEECWFFGKLLNSASTKTKMSRCNSDPCPSSNYKCQENMLARNDEKSSSSSSSSTKLARTPSLPSYMAREVEVNQEKQSLDFSEGRKPNIGSSSLRNSLIRAPSLPPPCVGREEEDEEEDQESEFTLGRLIRQASLNSSDTWPPRQTLKSSSIPRKYRPRKTEMEGCKEMGQQYQINPKKMAKSPTNLRTKEAQDFKALSLKSDDQSLKLDGPNKVSGLQEMGKGKLRRSSSLSAASLYLKKGSASTIPNWAAAVDNERKSPQDMKAQIKFWARAVASNALTPGELTTNQNC